LIDLYKTDPDSGYHKLRFRTRQNYDANLRRIRRDIGQELVRDIDARRLKRIHESWGQGGHISMAHSLVTTLRMLSTFGATWLKSNECRELRMTLSGMEFKMPTPQVEPLTADYANAIRAKAHEMGFPSIALAQAFQYDCMLGQKDVIGDWVPQRELGVSDVFDGDLKWVNGLRWSEIDDDLVLHHAPSNGTKLVKQSLSECPMVMAEFVRFGARRQTGPIVVYEVTKKPYVTYQFRRVWREVAEAAGVPDAVKNMNSRAPTRADRVTPTRRRKEPEARH
jgi:hypothetical protein